MKCHYSLKYGSFVRIKVLLFSSVVPKHNDVGYLILAQSTTVKKL